MDTVDTVVWTWGNTTFGCLDWQMTNDGLGNLDFFLIILVFLAKYTDLHVNTLENFDICQGETNRIGTWSWVSDGYRQGPLSHGYRFVSTGSTKIPLHRPTFKRLVKRFCVSQLIYFCSLRLSDKKSPAPRKCSQWQVKLLAQTQSCKIQCVCEQR